MTTKDTPIHDIIEHLRAVGENEAARVMARLYQLALELAVDQLQRREEIRELNGMIQIPPRQAS